MSGAARGAARTGTRLVLVGAGHAHLETMVAIRDLSALGFDVSVVGIGSYLYYSGMGPGLLSGTYTKDEVRFDVRAMVESRGGTFIDGRVVRVDPQKRLIYFEDESDMGFDIASFAVGSVIGSATLDSDADNVYTAKPIENLHTAGRQIETTLRDRSLNVVVSGGGPSGVEIAANAAVLGHGLPSNPSVTLVTRRKILGRFPERVRRRALRMLSRRKVRVVEDAEVTGIAPEALSLIDGSMVSFDMILLTTGTKPPPIFVDSRLRTGITGGLLVNEFLQSVDYPYIFGGGDCIDFAPQALQKIGVYAVRENEILLENFRALADGRPPKQFIPQSRYHLALNMGGGIGISYRQPIMIGGRPAFRVKDAIDRRFMRRYQSA
jgi:NADH dehydrogenase FAD-containing subunit